MENAREKHETMYERLFKGNSINKNQFGIQEKD